MKILLLLLSPFLYIYVWHYRIREKLFKFEIEYKYLPESITRIYMPVHMDFFWFRRGFLGRNKCLVPKGSPHSLRFDVNSPWYQTWIGSYYLSCITQMKFKTEIELVEVLGGAAIEDQNYWLRSYGATDPKSKIIHDSLRKVEQSTVGGLKQIIYYGEMDTSVDNSVTNSNGKIFRIIHQVSTKIVSIYNRQAIDPLLLERDQDRSYINTARLFGYFSIIQINPRKYILTYVCATLSNKIKVNDELLKTINSLNLI